MWGSAVSWASEPARPLCSQRWSRKPRSASFGRSHPPLGGYPGLDETVMRRLVDETRRTGFAVSRSNVVKDVIGIGMAIPQSGGTPYLALSIAALASQADDRLVENWKQIIRQEIEAVLREAEELLPTR